MYIYYGKNKQAPINASHRRSSGREQRANKTTKDLQCVNPLITCVTIGNKRKIL